MRVPYLLLLLVTCVFLGPAPAQDPSAPLTERAFPFKALSAEITVTRDGLTLPILRVPELKKGDEIRLHIDLEAPEWTSMSSKERQRLRDWSIGWFLTTSQGSLIYDKATGKHRDRGRIDLAQGQDTIIIPVDHDRQKFPIFFFVRTRTLESWEVIRETRETKAANFLDHFGRYSDVVDDYEGLRTFLTALERESPQAESVEGRLKAGFEQLGFSVDTKMDLRDPKVVGKLLGELEQSISEHGKTFQAQAAGKLLSQMIGDSDLGLIGAAIQIGGFLYRSTDYQENYRWSSAKLRVDGEESHYSVMSSEPIRYGEAEKAEDGAMRNNVRSILVCTPVPTALPTVPLLNWESDSPNRLVLSTSTQAPEVPSDDDQLLSRVRPALSERFVSPDTQVWDSVHGLDSPLRATISSTGALNVQGMDKLWARGEVKVDVKVQGRWGFEPFTVARFTALRSPKSKESVQLLRAPYLLTQGRRYSVDLVSSGPVAASYGIFGSEKVELKRSLDPEQRGTHYSFVLDPAAVEVGPAKLSIYAGSDSKDSNRLLDRDFFVTKRANFHVVLPEGSTDCELVVPDKKLSQALNEVAVVRLAGGHEFQRKGSSNIFWSATPPSASELENSEDAVLSFSDPKKGDIRGVQLDMIPLPKTEGPVIYPPPPEGGPYTVDLDSTTSHVLGRGTSAEFRLVGLVPWKRDTQIGFKVNAVQTPTTQNSKGTILFGKVTPDRVGPLACHLSVGIEESQLRQEWTIPTPWKVVDVPRIRTASVRDGSAFLEGADLDVLISKVFRSEDPELDPWGGEPKRQADGSYRIDLAGFDPDRFWVSLRDLGDEGKRFLVTRAPIAR